MTRRTTAADIARRTPEYVCYYGMLQRCLNASSPSYHHYGGRGITVCARWRESFDAFRADMGPRPSSAHEIDRENNDGHYEPSNCRWAIRREQMNNTRLTTRLTLGATTKPLQEWARHTGISPITIRTRLLRGWSIELTLTTPPVAGQRVRQRRGTELAQRLGVSRSTLYRWIRQGKAIPES